MMREWLQKNLNLIKNASSVFTPQEGQVNRIVNILSMTEEKIEIDNFFDHDIAIFFVHDKTKYIIDLKIETLTDHGSTIFCPINVREEQIKRVESRIDLLKHKKTIFLSHAISDLEIAAAVEYHHTKIERATYVFTEALKRYFSVVEVYFFHEIMTSVRGKVIHEFQKPLFIANIHDPADPENDLPGTIPSDVYYKRIKPYERRLTEQSVCDITVPIMYRDALTFGHLYVSANKKYPVAMLDQIMRVAQKLCQQLIISKIIQPIAEKVMVIDLSSHGLGVIFTNRRLITLFKTNARLNFDLYLSNSKKMNLSAYVRNVGSAGKGYIRAGLEFINIPVGLQNFLDGFFDGLPLNAANVNRS